MAHARKHRSTNRCRGTRRHSYRPRLECLEDRLAPAAPATPVFTLPVIDGAIIPFTNVQLETSPFFDKDGDAHLSTDWELFTATAGGAPLEHVWTFPGATGQERIHTDLGDGTFLGSHAGRREALPDTSYLARARHRDNTGEVSEFTQRFFRTSTVVPGDPDRQWAARQAGYVVEVVATGFQLPVGIAFVPESRLGSGPSDPLFYVAELYGTIKVVTRDGSVVDYATNLLNFNPTGAFPGSGEQGIGGILVEPATGDVIISLVYSTVPGVEPVPHLPRVLRLRSGDGGLTADRALDTILFDPARLPGFAVGLESQGQSHQISNVSIGPDGFLYVHNGEGFDVARAQNLNSTGGKILRMTLDLAHDTDGDGTPDLAAPLPDNPFYDEADGIRARDYVFAYGLRNPFGGAWRASDGQHFTVENGPETNDRLSRLERGRNYLWNGTAASMLNFALYTWAPPQAPVNIAFSEATTFGGSGFPANRQDRAYVSLSGPTYGLGPQGNGKRIHEFELEPGTGQRLGGPATLVEYVGNGRASVAGLAFGPDGLYFTDLYRDDGVGGPIARGANVLRVKFVGAADFTADCDHPARTVHFRDRSTAPTPARYFWDFGDGTFSSEQEPSHTYAGPGAYDVRLTVVSDNGGVVTTVRRVFVGDAAVSAFRAEYFDNINFTARRLVRFDSTINFDWGTGSPDPSIGVNTFSVRWTGNLVAPVTGTYTFTTRTDDGVRLFIDGQVIIDQFRDMAATRHSGTIFLTEGQVVDLRMDYFENGGGAVAQLFWTPPDGTDTEVVVPAGLLCSVPLDTSIAAPSNLRVIATTVPTAISLAWNDDSDNEAGFVIERSRDGSSYASLAVVGPNVTTYTDTPGVPGVYFYRVRAFGETFASGISGPSNTVQGTVLAALAPTNLRATDVAAAQVTLAWTDNSGNEDGFRIERSSNGIAFSQVGTVGPNETTFADTTAAAGSTYFYCVRAFTAGGDSPNSNLAVVDFVIVGPATVNKPNGFVVSDDVTRNGGAAFAGVFLRLTDGVATGQAGSLFTNGRVGVARFATQFTFQIRPGDANMADGMAFVIQTNNPNALGPSGGGLGYGPDNPALPRGIRNSAAVKFDIFQNGTFDPSNNTTGVFTDGEAPVGGVNLNGTPINLRSTHFFRVEMTYDGTTLTVTIFDLETGGSATQTYAIDIPAVVGDGQAFVGFTAATGGLRAVHEVLTWRYEELTAPDDEVGRSVASAQVALALGDGADDEGGLGTGSSAEGASSPPLDLDLTTDPADVPVSGAGEEEVLGNGGGVDPAGADDESALEDFLTWEFDSM